MTEVGKSPWGSEVDKTNMDFLQQPSHPTTAPSSPKTAIRIGDEHYDIDVSKIPYLSSFVDFRSKAQPQLTEFVHGPIPLFDVALKGIETGYRNCFRSLPADLSQHHILCETYEFLCVDILAGQSINDIFDDLRSGKGDSELEYRYYRKIKSTKSKARDAAFKLLYLILLGEFKDEMRDSVKIFNAVLFLVSHSGTFKRKTRKVVRAAYEERFVISTKQRANLDRWEESDTIGPELEDEREVTTEEDALGYYYDFDFLD